MIIVWCQGSVVRALFCQRVGMWPIAGIPPRDRVPLALGCSLSIPVARCSVSAATSIYDVQIQVVDFFLVFGVLDAPQLCVLVVVVAWAAQRNTIFNNRRSGWRWRRQLQRTGDEDAFLSSPVGVERVTMAPVARTSIGKADEINPGFDARSGDSDALLVVRRYEFCVFHVALLKSFRGQVGN